MADVHRKETKYGFEFGALTIERMFSDKGKVFVALKTPRAELVLYVTKTGKLRVFKHGGNELIEEKK